MKYKVIEGSETALKLQEIFKEIAEVRSKIYDFCIRIGGTGRWSTHYIVGPVSAIEILHKPEGWKQIGDRWQSLYAPKSTVKANIPIIEEMDSFKKIDNKDVAEIINFKTQSFCDSRGFGMISCPEINQIGEDCSQLFINVPDKILFEPNDDIVQITDIEYQELSKNFNQ